jgi:cytochrome c oxidase assembly protein subunit 11
MNAKSRTALALSAIAATMLAGAFASKPLYDAFCRATGFGGETQRADAGAVDILDRTVTVLFDANVAQELPIEFAPVQRSQTLRLGENGLAFFRATNLTDRELSVVATFNVTPFKAGPYFNKIECFCFTDQTLGPGESVEMPVIFYVDPALADRPSLDDVGAITLSYTMFSSLEDAANLAASDGLAEGGEAGG